MQILSRSALVFLASISLSACDEVQQKIENIFYKGTHVGVQKCIERNSVDVVSERTIKLSCARNHQKPVWIDLNGRSGYRQISYSDEYSFGGYVENKSIDVIVTSFDVFIHHRDMPENASDSKRFENMWIEPGRTYHFELDKSDLKYQPSKEHLGDDDYYSWYTSNEMGVEIQTE